MVVKLTSNPLGLEEDNETIIELFADDGKRLRSFHQQNYSSKNIRQCEDEAYMIIFANDKNVDENDNAQEISVEFIRNTVLAQINLELSNKIDNGVFLPTSQGLKQFSFEEHDQRNIANICTYLQNNQDIKEYFYHANGEVSALYSREDLFNLYEVMLQHISEWTEKYRILKNFINNCESIETLMEVNLEFNIPEEEIEE